MEPNDNRAEADEMNIQERREMKENKPRRGNKKLLPRRDKQVLQTAAEEYEKEKAFLV
ncbi:uncharacterized protein G2W53_016820 [Senna tora]|uniref:Uncharacterized protein n=1 Tax=Senna tora TaxID=362788 RepID=A0A834TRM5_9FABA|nr:uncharacterized protein G2W53_016820 [Senna tora]